MDVRRYTIFLGFWKYFPVRLRRLLEHFIPRIFKARKIPEYNYLLWPFELIALMFDLIGFPDFILQIRVLFNREIRLLNDEELNAIQQFYGDVSFISSVWMNPRDIFNFRNWAHAFVFHDTINFHHKISRGILIHEFMHVIQYHLVGSVYIIRALMAQRSREGYNYGSAISIYHDMIAGKVIWDYNYEQQAQIMQDYYEILHSETEVPSIIEAGYQTFLYQVKEELLK